MEYLDLTLDSGAANLALDEALLLEAEAGTAGEVLRLWEWPHHAVVLGSGGVLADDVQIDACRSDGIEILRRSSGGGTVLLGSGCLCFSLILQHENRPELAEIRPSYAVILGRLIEALALPGLALQGISDITLEGRKFSGNAQQRKRRFVLHHGTILHAFDLQRVGQYLRLPPRRPDYRGTRTHEDFVGNLGLERALLIERLQKAWPCNRVRVDFPTDLVQRLVAEKYSTWEWVGRR